MGLVNPAGLTITVIQTHLRCIYSGFWTLISAGKFMVFAMVTGSTNILIEAVRVTEVL